MLFYIFKYALSCIMVVVRIYNDWIYFCLSVQVKIAWALYHSFSDFPTSYLLGFFLILNLFNVGTEEKSFLSLENMIPQVKLSFCASMTHFELLIILLLGNSTTCNTWLNNNSLLCSDAWFGRNTLTRLVSIILQNYQGYVNTLFQAVFTLSSSNFLCTIICFIEATLLLGSFAGRKLCEHPWSK